jgi:hypothetical protein
MSPDAPTPDRTRCRYLERNFREKSELLAAAASYLCDGTDRLRDLGARQRKSEVWRDGVRLTRLGYAVG